MKKTFLLLGMILYLMTFSAQAAQINKVAAVVNGKMISMYDLQTAAKPDMLRNKLSFDDPAQRQAVEKLLRNVLEGMILDILATQEAERLKITVSPGEVDAEITRTMQQSRLSKADFEKQLQREGLTPATLRERVQKTILRQKLIGMMVGRKIVVTPEEIADYYEKHKDQISAASSAVRMAILVYPDNVNAKDMAKKIAAGTPFEQVVRQISIGPNKEGGGGIIAPWDKLSPEWRQRITRLTPGQISDVFVLEGKNAQIKLIEAPKGGAPMDLAAATPQIENILREPRLQERFAEYTEQLRKKAVIDIRL